MGYVDSPWAYATDEIPDASPVTADSPWRYATATITNPLVGDSAWSYHAVEIETAGQPNLVIAGGEAEADWSTIVSLIEKTIRRWSIIQGDVEIPLAHHTATWAAPPAMLAGADPVGSASYPVPGSNVIFLAATGSDSNPGTSTGAPKATLAAALAAVPAGGTIVIREGVYHQGQIETSKACTIQPYPGETVWFDGSVVFTAAWTGTGGVWSAPYAITFDRLMGKTAGGLAPWTGHAKRFVVDQVWLDGQKLAAAPDNTGLPPAGSFSVNQTAGTLTLGSNPAGKTVRVVDLKFLLAASSPVTVRGIGIRRYAQAMIEYRSAALMVRTGSVVEQVTIQDCSIDALSCGGDDITVRRCTFQDTGHSGVMGDGLDRMLFEQNIIRRCNRNDFDAEPTTAGFKITRTFEGLTIRNNHIQDVADGAGIWFDTTVSRSIIVNNTIIGTSALGVSGFRMKNGIEVEGSDGGFYDGVQHWTYVVGNRITDCRQAGILCYDSGYIKVWNNDVAAAVCIYLWQDYRENTGANPVTEGTPQQSPWHTDHIEVCNNKLTPMDAYYTQLRCQCNSDAAYKIAGGAMMSALRGNWFQPAGGGLLGYLSTAAGNAWAAPSTLTGLANLAATYGGPLAAVMGATNYQGVTLPSPSNADPLPAVIAASYGVPTARQGIGPMLLAPVPVT